ncbi:unnamed protein product, partial [Thlaspi arvense]
TWELAYLGYIGMRGWLGPEVMQVRILGVSDGMLQEPLLLSSELHQSQRSIKETIWCCGSIHMGITGEVLFCNHMRPGIHRFSFIAWLAVRNGLATSDRMQTWGYNKPTCGKIWTKTVSKILAKKKKIIAKKRPLFMLLHIYSLVRFVGDSFGQHSTRFSMSTMLVDTKPVRSQLCSCDGP